MTRNWPWRGSAETRADAEAIGLLEAALNLLGLHDSHRDSLLPGAKDAEGRRIGIGEAFYLPDGKTESPLREMVRKMYRAIEDGELPATLEMTPRLKSGRMLKRKTATGNYLVSMDDVFAWARRAKTVAKAKPKAGRKGRTGRTADPHQRKMDHEVLRLWFTSGESQAKWTRENASVVGRPRGELNRMLWRAKKTPQGRIMMQQRKRAPGPKKLPEFLADSDLPAKK